MWHSPSNKMCDFEWKRHHDNITMQDCPLNENHEKIQEFGSARWRSTCGEGAGTAGGRSSPP